MPPTPKQLALLWLAAVAYTALVVGEAFLFAGLLPGPLGMVATWACALAPVVVATFWAVHHD